MAFIATSVSNNLSPATTMTKKPMARVSSVQDVVALFPKSAAEIHERIEQGINDASAEIQAIIAVPDDQRTFANTAYALDKLTSISDIRIFKCVLEVVKFAHPDTSIRLAAQQGYIKIGAFLVEHVYNNYEIYRAFQAYVDGNGVREQLTNEQHYYIKDVMSSFIANGLALPDQKRQQVIQLKKELAQLETDFEANINQDNRTIVVKREDLKGLDDDFIAALKRTADDTHILGVDYPTFFTVIENCSVEATRKALLNAFENRAYPANEKVLVSVIAKRDELAHLLGFESYAHVNMYNSMAGTPERAEDFLKDLLTRANQKAQQEFAALTKELPEGVALVDNTTMQPWNWAYTKSFYKKKHFNIDERVIAEYFPMEKTVQGLLDIYRQFLSIEFRELPVTGLWHQDVTLIEVSKNQKCLGYLLLDLYPRDNKYGHACECGVISAITYPDGTMPPAVAVVIANFPKSTEKKPSLLKLNDVSTFFHEFGHALHDILGRTTLGSLAGTSTKLDFVELPSQMLEEWLSDVTILQQVSSHYKTGECLPKPVIESILSLKTFDTGDFLQRQIFLSMLALECYKKGGTKDPYTIYADLYKRIRVHMNYDQESHMYASFGHLMGYGAQYYGYMWSKVFALDVFYEIKKHGLLNPVIGQRYIQEVIGKGGSQDPNELLVNFLGRQPNSDAFFKDLGL